MNLGDIQDNRGGCVPGGQDDGFQEPDVNDVKCPHRYAFWSMVLSVTNAMVVFLSKRTAPDDQFWLDSFLPGRNRFLRWSLNQFTKHINTDLTRA